MYVFWHREDGWRTLDRPTKLKPSLARPTSQRSYSALEPTDDHPNTPAEAEAKFQQSPDFQRYVVAPLREGPAGQADAQKLTAAVKQPKRGNPWRQFRILSARYLELLKNDIGNLAILLLQAPIIAIILFFLAGNGTFDSTSVATCPLHATRRLLPGLSFRSIARGWWIC